MKFHFILSAGAGRESVAASGFCEVQKTRNNPRGAGDSYSRGFDCLSGPSFRMALGGL
jgi:hypothetical protein